MVSLDSEGFGIIDKFTLGNNSDHNVIGNTLYVNSFKNNNTFLKTKL